MNCILCNNHLDLQLTDKKPPAYYSAFCTTQYCTYTIFSDESPYNTVSEYNLTLYINSAVYYISCDNGKYSKSEPRCEIQRNDVTLIKSNTWIPPEEILNYFERIMKLKAFL